MKTALIYDEPSPDGRGTWVEAEYESPETIQALLQAIGAHCDRAVAVPMGTQMLDRLRAEEPDLAFNIAEGRSGPTRESLAPALLEFLGIPVTGSDAVALGVSLNKAMTKHLACRAGVPTPPFRLIHSVAQAQRLAPQLHYPVLAKPNFGGSSVGVELDGIVHEPQHLPQVVEERLHHYQQPCLVEGYVRGVDVTVGLLGNDRVRPLPVGKIVAAGGMYSGEVKRRHDRSVQCPCDLPDGLAEKLVDWSVRIYRAIGARDFARADFMLDEDGAPHFLEINPLPGLSPYYGVFPELALAAGYDHTALIGRIMRLALDRTASSRSSQYERLATAAAQQRPHG